MATITKTDQPTETKKVFHVEVPREDVDKKVEELYEELQRESALPGFRKGKAPLALVKARFKKVVSEQSGDEAVNSSLEEILKDQEMRIIGTPKLEKVEKPTETDKPITYQLEIEYIPEYELNYEGLQIEDVKYEVTETEVGQALENLRDRLAHFEPVEDRPAEKGDFVMVDAETTVDGEVYAPATKPDFFFELGKDEMLPGCAETLTGAEAEQEFEIDSQFPDTFEDDVKGKGCHIKMKLLSIRKKVTPEPDDEFAKDFGFEGIAPLKENIRQSLAAEASSREQNQKIQLLIGALLEKNPVLVPKGLVDSRLEYLKSIQSVQMRRMGADDATIEDTQNQLSEKNREQAERQSRLTVVLSDIAEKEKIELTDQEFDDNLQLTAAESNYPPDAFASYVFKNGLDDYYKRLYLEDKVLQFLLGEKTEIVPAKEGSKEVEEGAETPTPEEVAEKEESPKESDEA